MKPRSFPRGSIGILPAISSTALIVCQLSFATTIDKANNTNALSEPASWLGGVVPGPAAIASWNAAVTSGNSTVLGGDLAWKGIRITDPGGAVAIGGATTLTLGNAGIDMAAATRDLTINSNLALATGTQTWNVPAGRVLGLGSGTFSRVAGATLKIEGSGTVTSAMSGLDNANGILGPWASIGGGLETHYATLNAGVIAPYTAAVALSGIIGVFGGMPGGGDGTANYDVSGTGIFPVYGVARSLNTIRYTGGGATQQSNTTLDLLTINGILNAGSGPLVIGGGSNALRVVIGASNRLVLNADSAGITLANEIKNGASPGVVTIQGAGGNAVTLSGPNTYTGGTFVSSGRLFAGATAMNGGPIHVSEGGTLTFTGNNQTSTSALTGRGAILNDSANTIIFTGNHSGFAGTFTHSAAGNNTQFNSATAASANAAYSISAGELIFAANGNYTVQFGELSRSGGNIRGGNAATGVTTLEVGNLNTNSTITGNVNNGATKVLALTKVGTGTLTLGGTNTYSGPTIISAGTLVLQGSIAASSTIENNANLVFDIPGAADYSNVLTGTGNLTLAGGNLTLSGVNHFSGQTRLQAGDLRLRGSFGPVTVADDWQNSIGPAATGGFTAQSLTFEGEASLDFNLSGTAAAPASVNIIGGLSTTPANGKVGINIVSPALGNGNYPLLTFGTLSAGLQDFELMVPLLNSRQSATLVTNGNTLAMQVDGDAPKWTGLDSQSWSTGPTGPAFNWRLINGGTPTNFQAEDDVVFDDSAPGSTTVTINNGDVDPRVTVFNNNLLNYTLTSSSSFGIFSGSLRKSGSGSLTISSQNFFNQGFVYEGGTLNINSSSAIGTGLFSISPGAAKVINNTSGSPVANEHPNAQRWLDDFTFAGGSDLDLGIGTVTFGGDDSARTVTVAGATLTVGELKAPSHGLVKAGPGVLVLSSTGAGNEASVLAGVLNIAEGTLRINRSGTDALGSGDLTATGLTGNGTLANGADVERRLFINSAADQTFNGTITNGGPGTLSISKQGEGRLTLAKANSYTGDTFIGAANGAGVLRAIASGALGSGTIIFDGSGGNPGPTSRLELESGITLANPISLNQRNNPSPIILSVGGNNTLTGNINLNVGGSRANIEVEAGLLTLAGAISTTAGSTRNLYLGGAGNGLVSGVISDHPTNPAVRVAVHKDGLGSWTLSGNNTYTGETIVNGGTLAVTLPVLADAAAVRIAADGTLHLGHGSIDTVDRLFIDGIEQFTGTWGGPGSSATHKSPRITGTGILNVVNGTTPPSGYGTWAAATGLTTGVNDGSTFDADGDGFNNGTEYILGGLPRDGGNNPKIYSLLVDSSADADSTKELVMTIAVPVGTPAFPVGGPASTVTFEGFVITVRGSNDLQSFAVPVMPVAPITAGLPPAPVQGGITYEYRSFSLGGSNGLAGKGFLQVGVTSP